MVRDTPIICQHCRKPSGYTNEELMHLVITTDLRCKNCGGIVIRAQNFVWGNSSASSRKVSWDCKEKRREFWWGVNP